MSQERLILEEIRSRLQTISGLTIYLGKSIDPAHDAMPAATVYVADPLVMIDNQVPGKLKWEGMFDVQGDAEVYVADPMPTLMDFARQIKEAVYTPFDLKMGGVAYNHEPAQVVVEVPPSGSRIGSVLVRFKISYVELFL